MKVFRLLIPIILSIYSCSPGNHCSKKANYLSKVDTTKPYNIIGIYCVSNKKDTLFSRDHGAIRFVVFDRITGKSLNNGVIWLIKNNDTTKIYFNQGIKKLPIGRYLIFVSGVSNLPLKIKKFDVENNKLYEINCYLGNNMQY